MPSLSWGNAEDWWGKTSDGYQRGQTPKLGAVACWRKGVAGDNSDGAGHVAIVEHINEDGSIITSDSGWGASRVWWETNRQDDGNWGSGSAYTFQGFIYNPIDFEGDSETELPTPVSGNRYLSLAEMQNNALYIYYKLSANGWSLNAIAGMMGNFQSESTINPDIWESLNEGNTSRGYGLVQWTPATKYLDWCTTQGLDPAEMDSALARIEYELANGLQYYATDEYPETFAQFKTSTKSAYYLGMAFVTNYERPAEITTVRGENAEYWYNYLLDYVGTTPSPDPDPEPGDIPWRPSTTKGMPLWLLITSAKRRF